MLIKTRYFGEIDVDDQKIITFDNGLIGFEYLKKFTLIYNNESETSGTITWLQSLDEPMVAFPALSPFYVMTDYNPIVEDEVLLNKMYIQKTVLVLDDYDNQLKGKLHEFAVKLYPNLTAISIDTIFNKIKIEL